MAQSLSETLLLEINSYDSTCPPVEIWIDEAGNIFWSSDETSDLVWIDQDQRGIDAYLDIDHAINTDINTPDCIQGGFVRWNNSDFENPYHVSDFIKQISTITK